MNLERSRLGRIYIDAVTKKHFFFPAFVILGVAIIILMTINTKVDVIKTYKSSIEKDNSGYILLIDSELNFQDLNKIFVYETKNEAVYQIDNIAEYPKSTGKPITGKTKLTIDASANNNKKLLAFLDSHIGKQIKADIPIGKISLLQRIFTQGGAEN